DRRRRNHDLASPHGLGVSDGRERHSLLVLAANRRQLVPYLVEGEPEARDVAVAEDGEHAREQRYLAAVDDGALGDQEAQKSLSRGQSHCLHRSASRAMGTTSSQAADSHERISAACTAT